MRAGTWHVTGDHAWAVYTPGRWRRLLAPFLAVFVSMAALQVDLATAPGGRYEPQSGHPRPRLGQYPPARDLRDRQAARAWVRIDRRWAVCIMAAYWLVPATAALAVSLLGGSLAAVLGTVAGLGLVTAVPYSVARLRSIRSYRRLIDTLHP